MNRFFIQRGFLRIKLAVTTVRGTVLEMYFSFIKIIEKCRWWSMKFTLGHGNYLAFNGFESKCCRLDYNWMGCYWIQWGGAGGATWNT